MSEPIGEFLIKRGKLTEKQLSSVLERQVTMGGRLGTNLIELGYVTEEELTELLSENFSIPSIKKEELEKINPDIIKLVPRETAQKYSVIPFKKERSTLSVALLDPQDLGIQDDLKFITGCSTIKPHVASEVRLHYALEQYYQIGRQLRYVSLLDDERKKHAERVEEGAVKGHKDPTPEEMEEALGKARADWVEARDRDEGIGVFLRAAAVPMDRGVFFVVKPKALMAWMAFPEPCEAALKGLEMALTEAPIFKSVLTSKSIYKGAAPPGVGPFLELYKGLGGEPPGEVILAPVLINDQVIAIFYGDNKPSGRTIKSQGFLGVLCRKLCMVLEILILKKKILEM